MQTIQLELVAEAEGQAELVLGVGALNIIVAAAKLQFNPVGQTIVQPQFQTAVGVGSRSVVIWPAPRTTRYQISSDQMAGKPMR